MYVSYIRMVSKKHKVGLIFRDVHQEFMSNHDSDTKNSGRYKVH